MMIGFKKIDVWLRNLFRKIIIVIFNIVGIICFIFVLFMCNDFSYLMLVMLMMMCVIVVGLGVYFNKK